MRFYPEPLSFEWDEGNARKNWAKHRVSREEAEEVFFDERKKVMVTSTGGEQRFILIGKTRRGRLLFLVYTVRGHRVRVISARDINRKEVHLYEEAA